MRALVTGADGFAGRWLCKALIGKNATVVGWVRQLPASPVEGVRYRAVDVRSAAECIKAMALDVPDRVFHLAAITHLGDCTSNPDEARRTNVVGTSNVFRSMPEGSRGILSSTCHVYGLPEFLPITENHPTQPLGVYAQSKLDGEAAAMETGRPVVIARAFHHTGPGQSTRYAIADWCAQIKAGSPVLRVGNVDVRRDYTDVRDVVDGYQLLIERGKPGEVYNLCSGNALAMSAYIQWAANGRSIEVRTDPKRIRSADVPEFCGDPGKAESLGWKRGHALEKTMFQMAR